MSILDQLFSILLPATCLACGADMPGRVRYPVCACDADLYRPWRGLSHEMGELDGTFTAGVFEGALRDLLHAFKYGRKDYLSGYFAARFFPEPPDFIGKIDFIVPVPMPYWREFRRGYNQSALLAIELGRKWGKPVVPLLDRRDWGQRTQASLNRRARFRRAENMFRLSKSEINLRNKGVLLIDDVITTGATLQACARLLRKAGAENVYAAAVARDLLRS